MCGLVSIVCGEGVQADQRRFLDIARDALAHRGPDDATTEVVDGWVGLAHRRLSIIDLHGSRQPLRGEEGRVVCVFNGEIYNFLQLRKQLTALGHSFHTQGDGEVIVHGYEEWGDRVLDKLEGMFAFVLLDRSRHRVMAARDRAGIKPLFWTWSKGTLIVASELKAILQFPEIPRRACGTALQLGALRMNVPWPLTAFEGVYRLPPGCFLSLERGKSWALARFARFESGSSKAVPVEELIRSAQHELEVAVSRQMVADVPVGAFLSGGIDSTLVVAMMSRSAGQGIHTFSVKVPQADESAAASETARRLGTRHHVIDMAELSFDELAALPGIFDEPFADPAALAVRALSKSARNVVSVALTGDGGDEVFGGYDSYRWISRTHRIARALPAFLHRTAREMARSALRSSRWSHAVRRGLRAVDLLNPDAAAAQKAMSSLEWSADRDAARFSQDFSRRVMAAATAGEAASGPVRSAMAADFVERLPGAMLTKVDMASMSASLEVRVPLLDDAVVRFAGSVVDRELLGPKLGKLLLRRVLDRVMPDHVSWLPKRGFAVPVDRWLRRPDCLRGISEALRDASTLLRQLYGGDVERSWRDFVDGRPGFSDVTAAMRILWFANVALWSRLYRVDEVTWIPSDRIDAVMA